MLVVLNALLPVFMLIALGLVLRRTLLPEDGHWLGLERIVYYVLFPALLIVTLARADLASVPAADVGFALLLAALATSALSLVIRPLLARLGVDGPAFTSVFQGATRFQTYVALSVVGNLYGALGLTLASVATVAMVPILNVLSVAVMTRYAASTPLTRWQVLGLIVRNPLIWACLIGIAISLTRRPVPAPVFQFGNALGSASLAVGLLVTGAGLRLDGLLRVGPATVAAVVLKLAVMPLIAASLALVFHLDGANLAVVVCCAAVPTSSSAYVLARQMGGDAPLLAQIITLQTALAAITMPLALALVR
ncbi:AEC family transporter [Bradyrhizobium sp. U87765 SZCCT0131]|uniref:AEC family transporter n=1 Tax=unclassified Bradyrhizobium TaxID=2631580 RepID=UPI001BA9ECC7|nr:MULTISPECIES: AEC family transporter [unclassified Bradyrhizobium]MBR1223196.1 AEC family transporter [Bradyrhizobium sp. U87765 SZCCT0131]MBR1265817.1 AEC family transporter [Bradyrhizobium sp. U87765 SZCCT0134]MBR1309390.1 AEC family transporter [Bradyrhizobium sp. U87765 SZCCT0110]MBR1324068.1 AEC family transporter [Bradyrhizobium sp. U87765 SZCCT0109]MBR1348241.1 AEC family transporter [Bradyrhizobium sp. U87765 SZCCT0048]